MKIRWSHEALERLIEIEEYISKDSRDRAIKFIDQLIEHADLSSLCQTHSKEEKRQ